MKELTVTYDTKFRNDRLISWKESVFEFPNYKWMNRMLDYVQGYQDSTKDYNSMEAWDNVGKFKGKFIIDYHQRKEQRKSIATE